MKLKVGAEGWRGSAHARGGEEAQGTRAEDRRGGGLTASEILSRLQELHFPSHYAPYHCDRPENPLYPLKLIYIEILNDTHRPEQ